MEFEQIACVHIDAKFVSTNMYHVGVIKISKCIFGIKNMSKQAGTKSLNKN